MPDAATPDAPIWAPHHVRYLVMMLPNQSSRLKILADNKQNAGLKLEVFRSVNGYNTTETYATLAATRLRYHRLCHGFEAWGNLANYLTRYLAFADQVTQQVPFQLTLEDDVALQPAFKNYVKAAVKHFEPKFSTGQTDLVRFGGFGEGYLTSLQSVRRILDRMDEVGISHCPDEALNMGGQGLRLSTSGAGDYLGKVPWKLMREPNMGDISRTGCLSAIQRTSLRELTRDPRKRDFNATRHAVFSAPTARHLILPTTGKLATFLHGARCPDCTCLHGVVEQPPPRPLPPA